MAEDLQTSPEAVGAPTGDVPVTAESPPPRPRTVQLEPEHVGPYRILERVGEGGMGLVYKAERQALAMLSHPNVAKVLDAGMTDAGRPYFAIEFVPGVPLCEYCDQNKLTVRERIELFIPVCHAIQHAHQKGIIHRDLKPSNILVTLFDGHPVPKVIDFGIAKATNQQLAQQTLYTQTGAMVGTPEYMSPEQAMTSGLDVDTRTDIYSLGVILYELLTGCLPFDPEELRKAGTEGMARIIRETDPQWPSTRLTRSGKVGASDPATLHRTDRGTLQRQIRGDLDWITLKAMAKDRTRRYETANGLAVDLKRYLDDEPVLARPPSASYRASKFLRSTRWESWRRERSSARSCSASSAQLRRWCGSDRRGMRPCAPVTRRSASAPSPSWLVTTPTPPHGFFATCSSPSMPPVPTAWIACGRS